MTEQVNELPVTAKAKRRGKSIAPRKPAVIDPGIVEIRRDTAERIRKYRETVA